jgi:TolB-like protein
MSFFNELKRRNVFKVAMSYAVLFWLVIQVSSIVVPALHLPEWVTSFVLFIGLLGFPFALFFAWAFELTPEGIKRTHDVVPVESITPHTGQKLNFILAILLLLALGYISYSTWLTDDTTQSPKLKLTTKTNDEQSSNAKSVEKVISLAVLPFVNLSNDPEQEYFVDGLTEELLNSLTRIKGLKLIARTSSFAYKNKNMDMRDIAKELDVAYLVEGSVRKSGEDIRITVQLIEAQSGSHILSDTFDRKLVKIFALQEEISNQVAAALKLSLVYKDDRYNGALGKLDYIAVEQLLKARALAQQETEESLLLALDILEKLNNKYPDTAEIIGLSTYSLWMKMAYTDGENLEHIFQLAERALALDNKNYDSLITLVQLYADYAKTRLFSLEKDQQLIRYYPALAKPYTIRLNHLARFLRPCEEIQSFLNTVPTGIFSELESKQYEYWMNKCLNPELAEQQLAETQNPAIADYWLSNIDPEQSFLNVKSNYESNPNPFYTAFYFYYLIDIGAVKEAARLSTQFDFTKLGYWSVYAAFSAYLNDFPLEKTPLNLLDYYKNLAKNEPYVWDISALLKQAQREEKTARLKTFLNDVPDYEISVINYNESLGLSLLQYHTGNQVQSQATAQTLFNALTEYKNRYPKSFDFWKLQGYYLLTSFYSGNLPLSEQILKQGFSEDYPYWWESYNTTKFILSPWQDNTVAVEYLQRIKADQQRTREKFGLN